MTSSAHSSAFQRALGGLMTIVWLMPTAVWACPLCTEALKGDAVGTALSATTLLLIAIPTVLFGSIGGWVGFVYWRAARRAATAVEAATAPDAVAEHPV